MSEDAAQPESVRDYAKWVWLGIVVMFAAMILAMFLYNSQGDPRRSTVRVRHILVKFNPADPSERQQSLDLISGLRDRIADGEEFAALAREYSDDPGSAGRGGDLGYAFRDTYDPEFERLAWSLPVGELSPVFTTAHGFHILRVEERDLSKMDQYQEEIEKKADEMLNQ